MREFNLLGAYPNPKNPRLVGKNIRTIKHRIVASKRDKNFFDGKRDYGYGGYKYDGRWAKIAKNIIKRYSLKNNSNVLQLASEKGFLLHEFKAINPKIEVHGLETSDYAISKTLKTVRKDISKVGDFINFKTKKNKYDFVLALGVVYTLTLGDAIKCIKKIQKLSNGKSFITLATYESEKDYWLFKNWTVLGTTMLRKNDWKEVLRYCKYSGDYFFTDAKKLSLKKK